MSNSKRWASACGRLGRQLDQGRISVGEFALEMLTLLMVLEADLDEVAEAVTSKDSFTKASIKLADVSARVDTIADSLVLHARLSQLLGRHYRYLSSAVAAAEALLPPSVATAAKSLAHASNVARHAHFHMPSSSQEPKDWCCGRTPNVFGTVFLLGCSWFYAFLAPARHFTIIDALFLVISCWLVFLNTHRWLGFSSGKRQLQDFLIGFRAFACKLITFILFVLGHVAGLIFYFLVFSAAKFALSHSAPAVGQLYEYVCGAAVGVAIICVLFTIAVCMFQTIWENRHGEKHWTSELPAVKEMHEIRESWLKAETELWKCCSIKW